MADREMDRSPPTRKELTDQLKGEELAIATMLSQGPNEKMARWGFVRAWALRKVLAEMQPAHPAPERTK